MKILRSSIAYKSIYNWKNGLYYAQTSVIFSLGHFNSNLMLTPTERDKNEYKNKRILCFVLCMDLMLQPFVLHFDVNHFISGLISKNGKRENQMICKLHIFFACFFVSIYFKFDSNTKLRRKLID